MPKLDYLFFINPVQWSQTKSTRTKNNPAAIHAYQTQKDQYS